MSDLLTCQHGHLKRQCELCERDVRIKQLEIGYDELRKVNNELLRQLRALKDEPEPQQQQPSVDLAPTSSGALPEQNDTPRVRALEDSLPNECGLLEMVTCYEAMHELARQLERENTTLLSALTCADEWVSTRACGDNCYVSNQSDGDPGARCNCGRASVIDAIIVAYDAVSGGVSSRERFKTASKPNEHTAVVQDEPEGWVSEEQVAAAAKVIADSLLIDAPKLPAECWHGLARAVLAAKPSRG